MSGVRTMWKLSSRQFVASVGRKHFMQRNGPIRSFVQCTRVTADLQPSIASACIGSEVAREIDYYKLDPLDQSIAFGDFSLIASQAETGRDFVDVEKFGSEDGPKDGDVVWIRGRVSSVRAKGGAVFVVLRSGSFYTLQVCHFKDKNDPDESKKMIKYAAALPCESIVDIMGTVTLADVKSCSVSNMEIHIKKVR